MLKPAGIWFLAVGASAALVHFLVFVGIRDLFAPELANLVGFLVAFGVSFSGHRLLSFRDATVPFFQSLRRFFLTAGVGFLSNELVLMLLLRGLGWPDWLALILALTVAAGQTFLLSRFWAFAR